MRVYISGKITGLKKKEAAALFAEVERQLLALGHEPVNPLNMHAGNPPMQWTDYMVADIAELFRCDAIYMLENWEDSKGATIEHSIAENLQLPVIYNIETL